jgi:formate hydrogenlyase subunit 3/multisubunit Na+/H+ antiporter MnhD subunit
VLLVAAVHAALLGSRRSPRALAWTGAGATLVALATTAVLWPRVAAGERLDLAYLPVAAGFRFDYAIDALGVLFAGALLSVAALAFIAMALDEAPSRAPARLHTAAHALLLAGVTVCFAGNLLLLYAGLEAVTFAAFVLFTCGSRRRAQRAARWAFALHAAGLGLLAAALWLGRLSATGEVAAVPIEAWGPGLLALALAAGVARVGSPAVLAWAPQVADRAAGDRGTRGILALALGAGSLGTGLYLVARLLAVVRGALPHPGLRVGLILTGFVIAAAGVWVAKTASNAEGLASGVLLGEGGLVLAAWGLPAPLGIFAALTGTGQMLWLAGIWLLLADRRTRGAALEPPLAALLVGLAGGLPLSLGFVAHLLAVQAALASGRPYAAAAGGIVLLSVMLGAAILTSGRRVLAPSGTRPLTPRRLQLLWTAASVGMVAAAALPQWGLAPIRQGAQVIAGQAAPSFGIADLRAIGGAWPAGYVASLAVGGSLMALLLLQRGALRRVQFRLRPSVPATPTPAWPNTLPWVAVVRRALDRLSLPALRWGLAAAFVFFLLRG